MKNFSLQIITPDGEAYNGQVQSVVARTTCGDVFILASHTDYVSDIECGFVKIKDENSERYASCIGGFLTVSSGKATIIATTFEFAEDIDVARAKKAKERAERIIESANDEMAVKMAKLKLRRALNRLSVSER